VAFFWNAGSSFGKDCASFASCCPTFWPSERTFFHRAWYASSLNLLVTGGGSTSELKP
jgi:hypothetical protein